MVWSELLTALEATPLVDAPDFPIQSVAAADLLSDILASEREEFVILTGQTSPGTIRTAIAVGALGVVVVRDKQIPLESVALAASLRVPLAVSPMRMFEACVLAGRLLRSSPPSR